ncbi:MAG: CDP-alcohol phosphatidyltransferase family protein [Verrucomicrobiia bacterium]
MTTANKITIFRILLIPVFIFVTLDYIHDCQRGQQKELQRFLACTIFALATVSDAVDGYIARRYHQKSKLGVYLDPLADKALLISALVMLSYDSHGVFAKLPLWFPVLVISRDVILLVGTILIHMIVGHVITQPRFVGKIATVFQMITLGWILLGIDRPPYQWPMIAAGLFTFASGIWYILDGVNQLNVHEAKRV